MIKRLLKVLPFAILIGMMSCRQRVGEVNNASVRLELFDRTHEVSEMEPYVAGASVIRIESGEAVPVISNVSKVIVLKNGDFILLTNAVIARYDRSGKYLMSYGKVGRGPGEYLKIFDICLSTDGKELLCLDHMNSVMHYDINTGTFKSLIQTHSKEKHMPNASAVIPSKDGGFFLFVPNPEDIMDMENDFNCLKEFNASGKLISEYVKRTDFNVEMSIVPTVSQQGKIYRLRPQENEHIVNEIEDGVVTKKYMLDFGAMSLPGLYAFKDGKNPWLNLESLMKIGYYKIPFNQYCVGNLFYTGAFGSESEIWNFLYDVKKNKGNRWYGMSGGMSMPLMAVNADSECLYFLYDKYGDMELPGRCDPMLKYMKNNLHLCLHEDENPYLVKVKFKNLE